MPEKMNFYSDFYRAGLALPERERQALYTAILDYFWTGAEPKLKGGPLAVFEAVRTRIDISKKRQASGRSGGASRGQSASKTEANPKQSASKREAYADEDAKQSASKTEANTSFARRDREGVGEGEKTFSKSEKVLGARTDPLGEPRRGPSYAPPTPAEVAEYVAASGGHPIDAERFCGWYGDHGWPADDWRGTAMSWSRDERDRAAKRPREVGADDFAEYR